MVRRHEPDDHDDVAREIRAHLELEAEERAAQGLSEEEARYAARRAFGSVARTQEDVRAVWAHRWLDDGVRDVRQAFRTIRRAPGFALITVLTLAIGIGTTTAVFSVADAVLLRPMPEVRAPQELVFIENEPGMILAVAGVGWPFLDLLRARTEVIADAFAWTGPHDLWMHLPGQPPESGLSVGVQRVSGSFFQTLDVNLVLGTGFSDQDARAGGSALAVISHALWRREFGMARDVVGRAVVVDGQALTIVGVAPPAFRGPEVGRRPDLWQLWTIFQVGMTMARMRPGASIDEVRTVAALAHAQAVEEAQAMGARALVEAPTARAAARGRLGARARLIQPLTILSAAGMLVLLVACTNVAGLLLAAGRTRRQELVVRLALGSRRGRLIRQLITESSVLAFACACCLLSVVVVGLVPAVMLTRLKPDAVAGHTSQGRAASRRTIRPGRLLVTAQVALALVLLAGAGLLLATLTNLYRINPGFRTDNTIFLNVARAPWARALPIDAAVRAALVERLEALPGVESVARMNGGVLVVPVELNEGSGVLVAPAPRIGGDPVAGETRCSSRRVSPGLFRTMGIRLVDGREFHAEEVAAYASSRITSDLVAPVIISQSLAERFFGQQSAVGRRVYHVPTGEVVGVVDDVKHGSLRQGEHCTVYLPMTGSGGQFVLAASVDPASLETAIAQAVRDLDASLEPRDLRTFGAIVADSLVRERLLSRLSAVYALIALVMTMIGIYGAVSYSVSQRTREIGIRMALGAHARTIVGMIARETGLMVGAGLVIGSAAAVATSRTLASLLFGVAPTDPAMLALAVLTLLLTSALACWLPARRAARVDPAMSLRAE